MLNPNPIIILSSWSSGSSAVAAFFSKCGAYLAPPYASTVSAKSAETFESEDFRQMLLATIDESLFEFKADPRIFRSAFKNWLQQVSDKASELGFERVALKHPLSALVLREIETVCDPTYVVVSRPFQEIEETRQSHSLEPIYGELGAAEIYDRIYNHMHQGARPFITIPITTFFKSRDERAKLLDYCDLDVTNLEADMAYSSVIF